MSTLFDVITSFDHHMDQFPALKVSIYWSFSDILDIVWRFRSKKLHHSVLRRNSVLWLLVKRADTWTKRSTWNTISAFTSSFLFSLPFLINVWYWILIMIIFFGKRKSYAWSISTFFHGFLFFQIFFIESEFFCQEFFDIQSIFITTDTEGLTDCIINFLKDIFLVSLLFWGFLNQIIFLV